MTRTIVAGAALLSIACSARAPASSLSQASAKTSPQWVTTSSGLQFAVLDTGTGPVAQPGQDVLIHETTRLMNGALVFDSYAINSPVRFRIGANQVIAGMDEAVNGMRVGGRKLLIVPPSLSKREVKCQSADPEDCKPPAKPLYTPQDTLRYEVLLVQVLRR